MNKLARTSTVAILIGLFTFTMTSCGGGSGDGSGKGSQSHEHAQQEHGEDHKGNNDHHHKEGENGEHHDMNGEEPSSDDTPSFQNVSKDAEQAMMNATDRYFTLKDAFVVTNEKGASEQAQKVLFALESKDLQSLPDEQQSYYQSQSSKIKQALKTIESSSDINQQRKAFEKVSDNMYKLIKAFGLGNGKIYRQYCPMAFDNEGAHWLSNAKKIRNPYFGDEMLECGKVSETL